MLSFALKPEKLASAIALLIERRPGLTKKQICKLLYFADKRHLLRYGRPITGDTYYALPQGPIPTRGLDAMNGRGAQANIDLLERYGRLEGRVFRAHRGPDLKALSKSDIAVLDEVAETLGGYPAWKLEEVSHREPAWKRAPQNGRMAFEDFFDGEPNARVMKSILIEDQSPEISEAR